MSDEQNPQPPSFQDKLQMDAKTLWSEHKLFFIIFGLLILIVKFRDILIDILVKSGKNEAEQAKQEDKKLSQEEDAAKQQADKLVEDAKNEPSKEQPVTDDWYKKKDGK